ncbi:MAG: electron transporter RnfD [Chitinophagaceae bacterium]|nr:MAG: electron transporter RnfD [Chitinophagaceae bacterium]
MALLCSACGSVKNTEKNKAGDENFVSYQDKRIQYDGRIGEKKGAAELYWSGSVARIRFSGSTLKALMEDYNGQNYFNVIIDGKVVQKIKIDSAKKWYTLAENLSDGEHVAELFKRTQINGEYRRGYTRFYGFSLPGGKVLAAPQRESRRMEFYGNSITCGHAVEDTTGGDSGASIYENNYLSYASLTARHFGAQSSCIAVSGIGLLAGFRKAIMPEIYNLRNPFDSTDLWDFSLYQPQVVVVNLLENDKAVISRPTDEHFRKRFGNTPPTEDFIVAAYAAFIKTLRSHYPKASIICVLGDMEITREGSRWPSYVQKAVASLQDKKVFTHFFQYKGTPGHPRARQHAEMASSIIRFIDQSVKW